MPPHVINYQGVTVQSEEISLPEPSSSYFIKISTCPELTRIYEGFLRPQVLKTIVTLTITACSKLCEPLPRECFQDFTSLNTLVLEDCPKLRLGSENRIPSSLKDLKIISCPSLLNKQVCMALENRDSPLSFKISNNYWDSASFSSEVLPHLTAFHSLQIRCCDELSSSVAMEYEGRPQGLPSLDLSIRGNFLLSISTWFRSLKSLSRLIISGGSNVNFLLSEAMRNLSGLRKLTLTECKQLQSLGLASLSSLEILTIEKCPKLKSFAPAEELSGLQDLAIRDCTNLVSLPADLIRIRSLKSLYISRCTSLRALPEKGVPSTLESLTIKGCPQLRNRCHKGGADRPKISHVTNITLE
ncbi:uncharacterized protein [Typha latifolia]|uniref:uncharacterized protein n=1 Tax=Typha latifolia TaxID=4733 RepID=UPI003C2EC838